MLKSNIGINLTYLPWVMVNVFTASLGYFNLDIMPSKFLLELPLKIALYDNIGFILGNQIL